MANSKVVVFVLLVVAVCLAGGPLWAEDPVEEDSRTAAESSQDETEKQENQKKKKGRTIEYEIPGGGFLTDPAIVQRPQKKTLNTIFPLWKSVAKGHPLPRPWSIGLVAYWQTQDYDLQQAIIGLGGLEFDLDVEDSFAKIDAKTIGVKGGLWVLPFFQVTGAVGYIETQSDIFLIDFPVAINPPSRPGQGPEIVYGEKLLELLWEGPYWSVSGTLVGGYKKFFGSLTFSYAVSRLDSSVDFIGTNDFTTERLLPKVGYTFTGTSVWIGASWMDETMEQVGSIDGFSFDVLITRADWTPVIGIHTILGDHWELMVEGGFGDRTSSQMLLGYRF